MHKYLLYGGIALAILVGTPTIALGGSFVTSLIQGKTPAEAVTIIAEQLDALFGRVAVLETKQAETDESIELTQLEIERLRLENENLRIEAENIKAQAKSTADKQACESLAKKMPDKRGYDNWGHTPTIVELYQRASLLLSNSNPNWDSEENIALVRSVYEEAKPLYEAYVAACGN